MDNLFPKPNRITLSELCVELSDKEGVILNYIKNTHDVDPYDKLEVYDLREISLIDKNPLADEFIVSEVQKNHKVSSKKNTLYELNTNLEGKYLGINSKSLGKVVVKVES